MSSDTLFPAAALSLRAGTVLSLLLVALHPTIGAAPAGEVLTELVKARTFDGLVHGGLIVLMLGFCFGFVGVATALGLRRPPVLIGLIAYAIGILATIGAAMIDGFVAPAFAARVPADQAGVAVDILIFAGAAIQYLTKLGFVGMSLGMLGCSLPLLRRPGLARVTGLMGLVSGGLPAVLILAMDPSLNPHLLILILLMQAGWNFTAAALLVRGPAVA
jgi:hypothetical protein